MRRETEPRAVVLSALLLFVQVCTHRRTGTPAQSRNMGTPGPTRAQNGAHAHWNPHMGTRTLAHAHRHTHIGTRTLAHAHWHTHIGTRTFAHAHWHAITDTHTRAHSGAVNMRRTITRTQARARTRTHQKVFQRQSVRLLPAENPPPSQHRQAAAYHITPHSAAQRK